MFFHLWIGRLLRFNNLTCVHQSFTRVGFPKVINGFTYDYIILNQLECALRHLDHLQISFARLLGDAHNS